MVFFFSLLAAHRPPINRRLIYFVYYSLRGVKLDEISEKVIGPNCLGRGKRALFVQIKCAFIEAPWKLGGLDITFSTTMCNCKQERLRDTELILNKRYQVRDKRGGPINLFSLKQRALFVFRFFKTVSNETQRERERERDKTNNVGGGCKYLPQEEERRLWFKTNKPKQHR